ncbi:MAG TPA: RDD family protein [Acidobacteriaceae bacterium]|nr:RDD family protein [Acidobacteriaceae bacterium]
MSTSPQIAELAAPVEAIPAWKQEVNARLSAHRNRRGAFSQQPALPGMEPPVSTGRARVAARVAERYAKVPSYTEALAAEAAKAARAAEAAVKAAIEARQAAQVVTDVLWAGLEGEGQSEPSPAPVVASEVHIAPQPQHYRVDPASLPAARHQGPSPSLPQLHSTHTVDPHPHVIDHLEEAMIAPAQPLPARLLEFPRELVASRKARPRIAEGPLRQDEEGTQLRIFEVETDAISHQPASAAEEFLPEWSSIRLDAAPSNSEPEMSAAHAKVRKASHAPKGERSEPFSTRARRPHGNPRFADLLTLQVAPVGDRVMAGLVDMSLVLFAFLLFVLVFVACTPHFPIGKPAMVAAAATLVGFGMLYQWLFFTFAETTPGMRYARIALCTFDDENPDRRSLQRRVGACCLAALPLGLGLLWALLDEERLGWHDRMTRTYQRSYR